MLLEALDTDALTAMEELVDHVKIAVDARDLERVFRLREKLFAMSMAPLRAFDELQLYQLSKASSSCQFLERTVGLSPGDAGASVSMARKLRAMPLTEAGFVDGTVSSGQARAIVANVFKRIAEQYTAEEADVLRIIKPLTPKDAAKAMQSWANYAHALVDDDEGKPPREEEFFHSQTTGGRYVSNGNFGKVTGAVIAKAIELAENDNPRDNDTRSPAQRRGEAIADVGGFYVDYQNRVATDPDAEVPVVPKTRNWPHLVGISTSDEIRHGDGAQLLDGPRIDAQAFEALSCTAQLLRLVLDEHGAIRRYELMPASVTDALFGAVAARDQHCRWPGCHKKPIHCDVHHVHFREHGGKNTTCNCCLMCKFHHHRAAHDPKVKLQMDPDGTLFDRGARGPAQHNFVPAAQPPVRCGGAAQERQLN